MRAFAWLHGNAAAWWCKKLSERFAVADAKQKSIERKVKKRVCVSVIVSHINDDSCVLMGEEIYGLWSYWRFLLKLTEGFEIDVKVSSFFLLKLKLMDGLEKFFKNLKIV